MKNKKRHLRRRIYLKTNPLFCVAVFINLLSIFLIFLIFSPQPSKAEVYLSGTKDTCGLVGVSIAGTPACNFYSQNTANGCVNPAGKPTSPGIKSQTMTVTLSSLDGKAHRVSYNTSNNFCNSGYFSTAGQYCNCVDNEVNQNLIITVPVGKSAKVTVTHSSLNGKACGSYQQDFSLMAVDGNANCHLGSAGAVVGGAINCETGTTCGSAPPPPPPPPPTNCTTTPTNCSACAAPANTCSNGNGTQTCTLTQSKKCNPVVISRACTLNNCAKGVNCTNQVCANSAPPPTATPVPLACKSNDYMLILDISSSMAAQSGNFIKIQAAVTALNNFVDTVSKNSSNRFALITFAKTGQLYQPLTSNSTTIKAAINQAGQNLGPNTCTQCGIDIAEQEAEARSLVGQNKFAVLVTDGEADWTETMNNQPLDYVLGESAALQAAQNAYKKSGMNFYTIGVGRPGQIIDFSFLQQIAQDTNGQFNDSALADDLDGIFQQVAITTGALKCSGSAATPVPTAIPPTPIPLYSISGNVFDDYNKNGLIDNGETNYSGTFSLSISPNVGTTTTLPNGSYSISNLLQGIYTVSYTSLPNGYKITSPLNGPPPSYKINVGSGTCSVNNAPGAACAAGNIANLNFGISNTYPWFQSKCGDIRIDNGISDQLPIGLSAIVTDATCSTPGLAFTGDTDPNFNQGKVSSTGQLVGGASYPEIFSASAALDTAYPSLLAKTQNASITPKNLASVCSLTNCNLPINLAHGIYQADSDVTLNANTFQNNANYIFLINGSLTINGNISVPNGSTALFSTTKNIIVAPSVGSPPGCACNNNSSNLAGWFIAGQSFIVNSQGNCNDLRLNVAGSVVANALGNGGTFQNNRDLCGSDLTDPTVSFSQRMDMILNAPQFIKKQQTISQELTP